MSYETAPTPTSATGTSFGGWVWFGLGSDCYVARQIAWGAGLTEPAILIDTSTAGDSASTATEEFLYYRLDALGSVIGLTDEQGDLVERYTYDPYGQVHIETNGGGWTWRHSGGMAASKYDNPLAFTGHRFDAATGLHAAHFRHYSPRLGRWLSRDPAGYVDGVNLYEYVGSSPVLAIDVLGLRTWAEFFLDCTGGRKSHRLDGKYYDETRRRKERLKELEDEQRRREAIQKYLNLVDKIAALPTDQAGMDLDEGDKRNLIANTLYYAQEQYGCDSSGFGDLAEVLDGLKEALEQPNNLAQDGSRIMSLMEGVIAAQAKAGDPSATFWWRRITDAQNVAQRSANTLAALGALADSARAIDAFQSDPKTQSAAETVRDLKAVLGFGMGLGELGGQNLSLLQPLYAAMDPIANQIAYIEEEAERWEILYVEQGQAPKGNAMGLNRHWLDPPPSQE